VLHVLIVTFPFFALVLAGYLAARRRMLPLEAIPGLNSFVLFFALPCMLFRFGAATPVLELLSPVVLGVSLVTAGGGLYQQVADGLRNDARALFGWQCMQAVEYPLRHPQGGRAGVSSRTNYGVGLEAAQEPVALHQAGSNFPGQSCIG
jgi:hypothetical protein